MNYERRGVRVALTLGVVLLGYQAVVFAAMTRVTNMVGGGNHTLFLKSDGSLWGMGYNDCGQLGDGRSSSIGYYNTNRPEQIVASNVVSVAAGYSHSLFVKSDGSLWAMGDEFYGQLGDGFYKSTYPTGTNEPEQIVASGVVAVAAGPYNSFFIKSDGSLWGMGQNYSGNLGDGNSQSLTNRPEQIVSSGVVAVSAGRYHTVFLKSDGSLWGMGSDSYGELGSVGSTNRPAQIVPSNVIAIATLEMETTFFIKSDGGLWGMGANNDGVNGPLWGDGFTWTNRPQQIVSNGVTAVAGGNGHILFLKADGGLWAMGYNPQGQLGNGTTVTTNKPQQIASNGVVAIEAGSTHSLFLRSDGSLWGMGYNSTGELGDGFTNINAPVPEQIVPSPPPLLTCSVLSKTTLQFNAVCKFGGTFYLWTSTNLAQSLSLWMPVATNFISNRTDNIFKATLTNQVNSSGQQFYILQSP